MLDLRVTLDEDGYPTPETGRRIEHFEGDPRDLLAAVKTVWKYAENGYWTEERGLECFDQPCTRYYLSTVGWSGNEELISALERHFFFWMQCWESSRRGGHYSFSISDCLCAVKSFRTIQPNGAAVAAPEREADACA